MKTYEERMQSVQQKIQRKQSKRKVLMATAGALCICFIVGLVLPLFKNEDDIQMYAESDYYKVIDALKDYDQRYIDRAEGLLPPSDADSESTGGSLSSSQENGAVQITDNQVAGIQESDLIKRSKTHIFYLHHQVLEVYPIQGEDTAMVSTWKIPTKYDTLYGEAEMYLSEDATRLTIVTHGSGYVLVEDKQTSFTLAINLDVSDPENIEEIGRYYATGSYKSSRMVGDQLMLISRYWVRTNADYNDYTTFLPHVGAPKNMQPIPAENIVVPDVLADPEYTVVTLLDSKNLSLIDSGAFMSYSAELYVSQERIYATRSYAKKEEINDSLSVHKTMTEVSCMAYGDDGLTPDGSFCVEGTVKNQYSMDEHDGVFRIVTATSQRERGYHNNENNEAVSTIANTKRNANLTCFKVGTWEQLAQVEQFAPNGETVESVRFDGDYAYVCTAVVVTLTDPVFFFDMSDLNNIKVKETGTIDGYSSSLIQLNDGYLMGIGYGEAGQPKVEIYAETETGVKSVCAFTESRTLPFEFKVLPTEYKAFYIDRENNLFGIPVNNIATIEEHEDYILLHFDGYQLHEVARTYRKGHENDVRGVVVDNCLYVFSDMFSVESLG